MYVLIPSKVPNLPSNATICVNETEPLSPSTPNRIANINIENYFYIQFDIKFVSILSTSSTKQDILRIGNNIYENYPTIFASNSLQFLFDEYNIHIIDNHRCYIGIHSCIITISII